MVTRALLDWHNYKYFPYEYKFGIREIKGILPDSKILRKKRFSSGSINFDREEVKFILDKILNSNNIDKLKKYLSIEFKNYQPPKTYIKVSRTI